MQRFTAGWGLLCAALGLALLGGCASLGNSRQMSVNVVHVVPVQASLLETTAALTLRLANESPEPLAFAGGVHRLYLNGTYVGRAVSNERLAVPALGTATQTVTVYLENLTLFRKFSELSTTAAPRIAYRLESRFHPADGGAFGRVGATTTGELDLSGFMELRDVAARAR